MYTTKETFTIEGVEFEPIIEVNIGSGNPPEEKAPQPGFVPRGTKLANSHPVVVALLGLDKGDVVATNPQLGSWTDYMTKDDD